MQFIIFDLQFEKKTENTFYKVINLAKPLAQFIGAADVFGGQLSNSSNAEK